MEINKDLQFYPTPKSLAKKAWAAFKNHEVRVVLEPSAGRGSLISDDVRPHWVGRVSNVECCEADMQNILVLRDDSFNVVATDFFHISNGATYSHIIMNPPFNEGVHHVLHAWDILWRGEIVAILNAETIRNPFSKERQLLANLIQENGCIVEFIADAFKGSDVEREADVEVVLIYLNKVKSTSDDWLSTLVDGLEKSLQNEQPKSVEVSELALPNSFIEDQCANYRMSVRLNIDAAKLQSLANVYGKRLGKTMSEKLASDRCLARATVSANDVDLGDLAKQLKRLKDSAWTSIISSSDILKRLPSAAQKRVQHEFESIKQLEFNEANVHGFLSGIAQSGFDLQVDALCDVFDNITKFHSGNRIYFKGWKSNDKHKTCGYRIKTTRFILPRMQGWSNSLHYSSLQQLEDIDKVFAMLDGKVMPDYGVSKLFGAQYDELRTSTRMASDYFEVRYFSGIGTIHFFPTRKDLIDRLNRIVGAKRQWIPHETHEASDSFWQEYEMAERCDKQVQKLLPSASAWEMCRLDEKPDLESRVFTAVQTAIDQNPQLRPRIGESTEAEILQLESFVTEALEA